MTKHADVELDLSHEDSPVPMIKTKETLDELDAGAVLKVKVSKDSAVQNLKTLITNNEYELLETTKADSLYTLMIKKL